MARSHATLLARAIRTVAESIPGVLVFDVDGETRSGLPAVIYADPEMDITAEVKRAYDSLLPELSDDPEK